MSFCRSTGETEVSTDADFGGEARSPRRSAPSDSSESIAQKRIRATRSVEQLMPSRRNSGLSNNASFLFFRALLVNGCSSVAETSGAGGSRRPTGSGGAGQSGGSGGADVGGSGGSGVGGSGGSGVGGSGGSGGTGAGGSG